MISLLQGALVCVQNIIQRVMLGLWEVCGNSRKTLTKPYYLEDDLEAWSSVQVPEMAMRYLLR